MLDVWGLRTLVYLHLTRRVVPNDCVVCIAARGCHARFSNLSFKMKKSPPICFSFSHTIIVFMWKNFKHLLTYGYVGFSHTKIILFCFKTVVILLLKIWDFSVTSFLHFALFENTLFYCILWHCYCGHSHKTPQLSALITDISTTCGKILHEMDATILENCMVYMKNWAKVFHSYLQPLPFNHNLGAFLLYWCILWV